MMTMKMLLRVVLTFPLVSLGFSQEVIQLMDATGDGMGHTLSGAFDMALDANGNVFVTGVNSDNAFRIAADGQVTQILDASGDGLGGTYVVPQGAVVDSAGNFYTLSQDGDRALRVTPAGVVSVLIEASGDGAGNVLDAPSDIAVDGQGNVFVIGRDSRNVFRITPSGTVTEILDPASGSGITFYPGRLAVDSLGNVFVSASCSNQVFRVRPDGQITSVIDSAGDGAGNSLSCAYAVAVDRHDNLYVHGMSSDNIFRITPDGTITEILDRSDLPSGTIEELQVDDNGNLYFLMPSSDELYEWTPNGLSTIVLDDTANGSGVDLWWTRDFALAPDGRIYVLAQFSSVVAVIDVDSAEVRNGSGANRNRLRGPVARINHPWSGEVEILDPMTPPAGMLLMLFSTSGFQPAVTLDLGSRPTELLIAPPLMRPCGSFQPYSSDAGVACAGLLIPDQPGLLGLSWSMQVAVGTPATGFTLTNALSGTL